MLAQSHHFGDLITLSVHAQTKTTTVLPIVRFEANVVGTSGSIGGQELLKRPLQSFLTHNFHKGRRIAIEYPRTRTTYQLSPCIQLAQLCQTHEDQIKPKANKDQAKPKSEHPSLGKDTLIGLEVRGKCLVIGAPFLLTLKKLCSTSGSFYPICTESMIKPLGKATPLLIHARSYPIPKGLQHYKGTHSYTNWFHHLIVQR